MKIRIFDVFRSVLMCLLAATLVAGCHKNDAVSQAEKADKINGVAVPGIEETKQIAQEGFIYGLPLVMYYTSAYELFVDPTSGQFKAPVGKLNNEARVFTYKDTAVMKGTRVQSIIRELRGEKIDIVEWSEDAIAFVTNALS